VHPIVVAGVPSLGVVWGWLIVQMGGSFRRVRTLIALASATGLGAIQVVILAPPRLLGWFVVGVIVGVSVNQIWRHSLATTTVSLRGGEQHD
jgi:hypothetical protein